MKSLLISIILISSATFLFAQDKTGNDFKKEAGDFYKAEDFANALTAFESALNLFKAEGKIDTTSTYNAGVCAYKTKNYQKALTYFDESLKLGYKLCTAYLFKANSLNKLEKFAEMEAIVNEGSAKCPDTKDKLNDILFGYYKKTGLTAYNNASKIQSGAAQLAKTNPDKSKAEVEKAKKEYTKALPTLEKAYSLDPGNADVKTALKATYEVLEMKDKAAKIK